ncbi:bifunctional folylpolyglutamate synthase/dihydrofolate synthase [Convivina intestini]|uniref:tetrahydrofolate synthase n=1 Tax=Convivina intestini TaxID=1505726 RepID=A0A2U1DBW4_9LACO|nr:folylpolyglutamate synthase/dihydrofolate synthase family protein [Convivina intestini]PVY85089.1 dihydrofolate synthase/folylpolyglutamate synthase [Convivina intestini]CAH1853681.1 Folylpolyglutamate synthase [Convivina intestini]SDB88715.1 dihydrofolate synthase / folylpolyglutamate synthase [Leuconostocaceae bacterium R-53105]
MKTVAEAINYIHSRPKYGQANTLKRMHCLLAVLGQPQDQLPAVIHVAGTNGKGSVATMISHILVAAGYQTGLFISPFVVDFRERIQLNNQWIEPAALLAYIQKVAQAVKAVEQKLGQAGAPTEFEVLTAIMILYFANQPLDVAVVEVGLGGLYDSTNVLPTSRIAVITSLAYDHCQILGKTLSEIAYQKAGIIHDDMQVVVGNLPPETLPIIQAHHQPIIIGQAGEFAPGLPGKYQIENTAIAVAAVRAFQPDLSKAVIESGLTASHFPGRFEKIAPNILIDGAHNVAGLTALVAALKQRYPGKIRLVIGSLADKNISEYLPQLSDDDQFEIILVNFQGVNNRPGLTLDQFRHQSGLTVIDNWVTLLQVPVKDLTVFTGSLYFISEVRSVVWQQKNN